MEKELFAAGLGIEEPMYIDEIVFDVTEGELHIKTFTEQSGNRKRQRKR